MHTKRIIVAFVINDFTVGGAQRLVADILSRIDRTQFDPVLITLMRFPEKPQLAASFAADIPRHELAIRRFADLHGWFVLFRLLQEIRPDVVVSNLFLSNVMTRVLALILRYRIIIVEHNTYVHKRRIEQVLDHFLSWWTYAIVAVSERVRDFTIRQERIAAHKWRVIRNGIDVAVVMARTRGVDRAAVLREMGVAADRRLMISVGRLTPQKNHVLMLEGFRLFAMAHPEYDLLLLGDGGLRERITQLVSESPVSSHIHILGNKDSVYEYLAASDFFVSTSDIEGLSIAQLESLAAGLPILATRTAGSEEVIREGENGLYIEDRTPESVATGMKHICGICRNMRNSTQKSAQAFDIANTVNEYEMLISEAAHS